MLEDGRLKIFRAVAAEGNFTRAARSLGITQPAVSQSIAELEQEMGLRLFDRERGGVRLTAAGETFRSYADLLQRDYDALNRLFGPEGRLSGRRSVRISAAPFVQEYLLPDLLAEIRSVSSVDFLLCPEGREADITFSVAPISGTIDFDSGARRLGETDAVAVSAGPVSEDADLMVWSPYRALLPPGEAARVVLESDSIAALLSLLRRCPGSVAYLPAPAVPDGVTVRPLAYLPVEFRLRMEENFSRSRLGVFFSERLSVALKKIVSLKP